MIGCTDELAFNYNSEANTDDGSCVVVLEGCTDELAFNYNSEANTDDGSCVAVLEGCTDESACNYNSEANTDDDSCILFTVSSIVWLGLDSLGVSSDNESATFQWTLDGDTIDGATFDNYVIEASGLYNVIVTVDGCELISETETSLTLNETELHTISLYPNPVVDLLNISIDDSDIKSVDVQLLNYLGSVVLNENLNRNSNAPFVIEVSKLDNGIYILNTIVNGKVTSIPWVKK